MLRIRLVAALGLATALVAAPVVTPVWAAPKPVTPKVTSTPLAGVDATALSVSPPAFDPKALSAPGASAPAASVRASVAARPTVLTSELTRDHFAAAGVTWSAKGAPSTVTVQVRIRDNGTWGDWIPLEQEGGPDPASKDAKHAGDRRSSEPVTTPHGDGIQVRVDTSTGAAPAGLALLTVDPGSSPADANLTGSPAGTAHAGTAMPSIVSRAGWGADENLRPADCSPDYSSTIKAGFVHHTVNANAYSPADSAGLVRAIYAFHVNGNGWCDVGYNFLVDRFGVVFEGRYGGVDRPVIGAQAGGFNTYTFGVSGIGDFTSVTPTAAMVTSISQVVGWKLGMHNRDPYGRTTLTSAGGPYTGYPAGTVVPVNIVSGHRDVDLTGCPGDRFYPMLGQVRAQAASFRNQWTYTDQDLYGVWGTTLWPPAGRVEVHAQGGSSRWVNRMTDVATRWASGAPNDWRFFIGSASGDTRPDLIGVHAANTASGRIEVKVASWASYYQETIINTTTPAATFRPDTNAQLSVGGPSGGDLYIVVLNGTGTGAVEVHRLSAASGYSQWSLNTTTGLKSGYVSSQTRFIVAKGTGDLYYVQHQNTGSRQTEVYALSASSLYRTLIWGAATPLGYTSDSNSQWVLGSAGIPDLFWVQASETGTGRVEVHALTPWTQYGQWYQHTATSLPALAPPGWQFSTG